MAKLLGTLIALAAAGGGIAAWYTLIHPSSQPCHIAGSVYATDRTPIPAVSVEYEGDGGKYEYAATTGPDGSFKFNCTNIKGFPLKLRLMSRDWSAPIPVADRVNQNEDALNFYIERAQGAPPRVYVGPPPGRSFNGNNHPVVVVPPPPARRPDPNRNGVVIPPPPSLGNRSR